MSKSKHGRSSSTKSEKKAIKAREDAPEVTASVETPDMIEKTRVIGGEELEAAAGKRKKRTPKPRRYSKPVRLTAGIMASLLAVVGVLFIGADVYLWMLFGRVNYVGDDAGGGLEVSDSSEPAESRPADAVETYRTAIDFAGPRDDTRALNAGMGQALSAAGRPSDALDAFNAATADGIYQLTSEQADELARVQDSLAALSAQTAMTTAPAPAMDAPAVDPLDPTGATGQFLPDPSDTGFFTLSESEMVQQDRQDRKQAKVRRRHRHTGLKVFIVLLLLILIAAGGLGFAYTRGFGFPSQESVVTDLFQAAGDGDAAKAESCLASSLSEDAKSMIISSIPQGATVSVEGMDQSMTETTAKVKASLSKGGEQEYTVKFVRSDNHIGWAVSSLDMDFSAADNQ